MNKQKSLALIRNIMRQNNLSLDDVTAYLQKGQNKENDFEANLMPFDLLCNVDGKWQRLSFFVGQHYDAIGIFPFADEDMYLELDEQPNVYRRFADEKRLPEHEWCRKLYPLKNQLNKCLQKLGKPILEGGYFVVSDYMPQCNWIVGFKDHPDGMQSDYYGCNETAKIRYIGQFS